jgi:hypothetical protein
LIALAFLALLGSFVVRGDPAAADVPQLAPTNKRVYVITDSVGLGAKAALPVAFPPDWEITLDGDAGEFTETLESKYVRPRMSTTPWVFGDYAVIAAGYNYPYWDPERFDRSIDSIVSTMLEAGVKHVFWVTLREIKPQYITPAAWRQIQPYYWYFPTVNEHLKRALGRHPQLSLIDWAAVADQPGLTYDAIHLNNAGSALYSAITRDAIYAATTAQPAGTVARVAIPEAAGVEAVSLNLTTDDPRAGGFLTAYDCDQARPEISNHNFARDATVAHAAIVPVSAAGEVCVYTSTSTNLIVDVTGRFGAGTAIGGSSTRLVDTRERGTRQPTRAPLAVDVGDGEAVVLNVTAVDATGPGWVRAAPCDSTDETSTLNVVDDFPVPNVAVVRPGSDSTACITASVDTHLIVDRFLSFGHGSGVDVATPRRLLDTREGPGTPISAGGVAVISHDELDLVESSAGVMINLTGVQPGSAGYLAAYPCLSGVPPTSNLNYRAGDVVANFAIVEPDSNGDLCIYSHAVAHVVVDLLGTLSGDFRGGVPQRLLDTRTANRPPGWP